MQYSRNCSLLQYNTFGIDVTTSRFYRFDTTSELQDWARDIPDSGKGLVIGGGSNLLFTGNFNGTIILPDLKGREIVWDNGDEVWVRFSCGEVWDHCVEWAVSEGLSGIENLSHIPGSAGAAPVQNIGAYGVEISEMVEYVEGIYLDDGESFRLSGDDCHFDYRYSIFKGPLRDQTVITSVTLRLSRRHDFCLGYGSLKESVERRGQINLNNVRRTVIDIRRSKLPDPLEKGNAGSFFKNPFVTPHIYKELKRDWPQMPGYELPDSGMIKVPAGWLIEQAGWKGKNMGRAGVHSAQALVLVNMGGASGREIAQLARKIQTDVFRKFGIKLLPEVKII
ncbi:MAG: UDP-N-acetylmuramate dehydrogenase [Marinilabilia sp.]